MSARFHEDIVDLVTMHHVSAIEANRSAEFEAARNASETTPTFSDLYDYFVKDNIINDRDQWENHSVDILLSRLDSFEACQAACQDDTICLHYSFDGEICALGHSIQLGGYVELDVIKRSGWLVDRIGIWVADHRPCSPRFQYT